VKNLLSKGEVSGVLSMNIYWEEVAEREDTSPLQDELRDIVGRLGTKVLFIIAEYAKLQRNSSI